MHALNRRQNDILVLLREQGRVSVEELASRFTVTPQTIRRDLNELTDRRLAARIHGGAMIASGTENLSYEARRLVAEGSKRAIGIAAARLVPDNSSLFINIGTTTEEAAKALAQRRGLMVITNNLHVAIELYRQPGIELLLAGGLVRRGDAGVIGAATVDFIQQFRVDTAIIGTSAIDPDGSLLDYDIREVRVSRAIMENARRVILVADCSKWSRSAPVRVARLAEVDVLVTDRLPDGEAAALCREQGVEVVETGGPDDGEDGLERPPET